MLSKTDTELAERYGTYASFPTSADPYHEDFHGDAPAAEIDRLLQQCSDAHSNVLDLGCGAGQTLCQLAPRVREIWGVDLEKPLLDGAQERARNLGLTNITLLHGDTTHDTTVAQLPDTYFHLVFSRRGPFLTPALMTKLTPDARFVLELYQDIPGLKELFGRKPYLPTDFFSGGDWAIGHHSGLGWLPVSVKEYFYEQYFRDATHFAAFLTTIPASLGNWWMESRPYDPVRDRSAWELYCRYNRTDKGIRLIQRRKVYLFRRATTQYYPVDAGV